MFWKHVQPRFSTVSEGRSFLWSKWLWSLKGCSTAFGNTGFLFPDLAQHRNPVSSAAHPGLAEQCNTPRLCMHCSADWYQMHTTKDNTILLHSVKLSKGSCLCLQKTKAKISLIYLPIKTKQTNKKPKLNKTKKKVGLGLLVILSKLALPPSPGRSQKLSEDGLCKTVTLVQFVFSQYENDHYPILCLMQWNSGAEKLFLTVKNHISYFTFKPHWHFVWVWWYKVFIHNRKKAWKERLGCAVRKPSINA